MPLSLEENQTRDISSLNRHNLVSSATYEELSARQVNRRIREGRSRAKWRERPDRAAERNNVYVQPPQQASELFLKLDCSPITHSALHYSQPNLRNNRCKLMTETVTDVQSNNLTWMTSSWLSPFPWKTIYLLRTASTNRGRAVWHCLCMMLRSAN